MRVLFVVVLVAAVVVAAIVRVLFSSWSRHLLVGLRAAETAGELELKRSGGDEEYVLGGAGEEEYVLLGRVLVVVREMGDP